MDPNFLTAVARARDRVRLVRLVPGTISLVQLGNLDPSNTPVYNVRVDDGGGMRTGDSAPGPGQFVYFATILEGRDGIEFVLHGIGFLVSDGIEEIGDDDGADGDADSGGRVDDDGGMRRRRVDSDLNLFMFVPIGAVGFVPDGAARARRVRLVPDGVDRDGRVWLVPEDDGGDGIAESGGPVDYEGGMRRADPRPGSGSGWRVRFGAIRGRLSEFVRQVANHPIEIGSTFTIIFEAGKMQFQGNRCSPTDYSSSKVEYIVVGGFVVAVCLTALGFVLHLNSRSRRYSSYVMKAGAMGCALATIVPYARLLPSWMGWFGGAACAITVAMGLVYNI